MYPPHPSFVGFGKVRKNHYILHLDYIYIDRFRKRHRLSHTDNTGTVISTRDGRISRDVLENFVNHILDEIVDDAGGIILDGRGINCGWIGHDVT